MAGSGASGTLKAKLADYILGTQHSVEDEQAIFRCWYNHVRPHQNLQGRTPAEVWNQQQPNPKGKHTKFRAWDGCLAGYYVPPG